MRGICLPDRKMADPQVAAVMRALLGESPAQAQRLARQWRKSMTAIADIWAEAARMQLADALARNEHLHTEDMLRLINYLRPQPRGVVLTTIHMGDYLQTFFALATGLKDRPLCIVRRKQASKEEACVFQKLVHLGVRVTTVRTSEPTSALKILRHLRRGGVVMMLFDLPAAFGECAELTFLDQKMAWVKGPVFVAYKAHALLVPFVSYVSSQHTCDILPLIAPAPITDQSVQCGVQQLAKMAEQYVRRYPEQWYHWHLVPQMLVSADV